MNRLIQAVVAFTPVLIAAVASAQGTANGPIKNQDSTSLPRFEDFRVPTPLPKRKSVAAIGWPDSNLPGGRDETDDYFRNRIRAAARAGPDFAGHYAVVSWGCGSDCRNMSIVDVQTGHIYSTPFVGVGGCPYHLQEVLSYSSGQQVIHCDRKP